MDTHHYLIQLLLPVADNNGKLFAAALYHQVKEEIIANFNGLTAYTRAPAEGLWNVDAKIQKDDMIIFEVMVDDLDSKWWINYKIQLQALFQQDEIIIRATAVQLI